MGSGVEVAIKKINSKRASVLSQRDTIASLLSIPQHRNINKYYSILKEKTHFYVIQTVGEYSLEQIYKHKLLTLATTHQDCCMQISHGLDFLHKHGILHMAVKPQNVFVGADNQIRLGDYGIHMREHQSEGKPLVPSVTNVSTCWLASEVIQNHCDVTTASDIASLGMVMFYVLSGGCHPFGDPNTVPSVCISNIVRGAFNLKMLHDPYPHHLIKSIIQKDADHRLKMDELLAHPYFWSDQRKEEYLEKLVRSALGGWVGPDGEIMDMLAKHEREIMNMYNKQEINEVNNIQELLTMIQG
uniref:Protein kinase domain-containing protein n=1 Tax=Ciona savignyi TaxID=51511 RepID=H2ZLS5_CIOSA